MGLLFYSFVNSIWFLKLLLLYSVIVYFFKLSALVQVEIEPVGQWYHQYEYSSIHGTSHELNSTENSSDESKDRENKDIVIEDDINFLRSLDPTKWKVCLCFQLQCLWAYLSFFNHYLNLWLGYVPAVCNLGSVPAQPFINCKFIASIV